MVNNSAVEYVAFSMWFPKKIGHFLSTPSWVGGQGGFAILAQTTKWSIWAFQPLKLPKFCLHLTRVVGFGCFLPVPKETYFCIYVFIHQKIKQNKKTVEQNQINSYLTKLSWF